MGYDAEETTPRSLVLWFCAVVFFLFLWPALLSFDAGDWPSASQYPHNDPTANACGVVGAWIAYQLRYLLGGGVYALLVFGTLAAVFRMVSGRIDHLVERGLGVVLLIACTAATAHLIPGTRSAGMLVGHGGLAGHALGELLRQNVDTLGTVIILTATFFVGLLFATEGWVLTLPSTISRVVRSTSSPGWMRHRLRRLIPSLRWVPATSTVSANESAALLERDDPSAPDKRRFGKPQQEEEPTLFDEGYETQEEDEEPATAIEVDDEAGEEPDLATGGASRASKRKRRAEARRKHAMIKAKRAALRAAQGQRVVAGPIVNFPTAQKLERAPAYPRQIENWTLPSLDLLHEPEFGFNQQQEVLVREQARILEQTLEEFRVKAEVVEIDTGPVITMFELRLGAGIKVSQVASLSNDIARAMKAHSIRVVAPISGKNTVGIEVPNIEKERVRLKELMTVAGARASKMALPLFLGKDASGQPLVCDLTKMPHLLIAGTTGSGKSVCLNSIILSVLMTKRPDHVKMILIDPKMVEMTQFKDMPHLMCPLVTDMQKGEKILEWAVTKMDERYELLAEARVKNIAGYNGLGNEELYRRLDPQNEEEKAGILTFLPYVVIVIDELADLMMTSGKEVEHHLCRLAQKSRAVGIHIIVATQRPEVKVVTGLIKSNLPSRISFRVASRMDSRIVLDQNGGEVLLGQGDMLMLPPGSHKLLRAQGTMLEDSEVHAVLDDLASRAKPEYHPELMRIKAPGSEGDLQVRDPLFDDAVRIVLQSKRGSVSLLQRRLTVGYSRASRLVEQMSEAGIVGDYKGSQAREVLLTLDEWDALQAQVARDLDEGYEADVDVFGEPVDSGMVARERAGGGADDRDGLLFGDETDDADEGAADAQEVAEYEDMDMDEGEEDESDDEDDDADDDEECDDEDSDDDDDDDWDDDEEDSYEDGTADGVADAVKT